MTLLERLGGRETVTRGIVDTFRAISRPPHPSGQEGAAADAVAALLSGLGLGTERDGAGNLLCRVPAAPGREGAPELVLQGRRDNVLRLPLDPPACRRIGIAVQSLEEAAPAVEEFIRYSRRIVAELHQ